VLGFVTLNPTFTDKIIEWIHCAGRLIISINKRLIKLSIKGNVAMISKDWKGLLETINLLSSNKFKQSLKKSIKQAVNREIFSFEEIFGK
jgi:hypothetical protein